MLRSAADKVAVATAAVEIASYGWDGKLSCGERERIGGLGSRGAVVVRGELAAPDADPPVADELRRVFAWADRPIDRPRALLISGVVECVALVQLAQLLDRVDDLGPVEPDILRRSGEQVDLLGLKHRDERHRAAGRVEKAIDTLRTAARLADLLGRADKVVPCPFKLRGG